MNKQIKNKQTAGKFKQIFRKSKRSFYRRLPTIGSEDIIYYRNVSLIGRFISEQGKILSRRMNRLTLKKQKLIAIAIKQARILSLLPFNNKNKEKPLEKAHIKKNYKKKNKNK